MRCCLIQKGALVTLVISGVIQPIFIKLAQDVDKILPVNIFNRNGEIFFPFRNAALPNEPIYPNFALKLVAMATSLEESKKLVRIDNIHTNTFHLVKKIAKNQSSRS